MLDADDQREVEESRNDCAVWAAIVESAASAQWLGSGPEGHCPIGAGVASYLLPAPSQGPRSKKN